MLLSKSVDQAESLKSGGQLPAALRIVALSAAAGSALEQALIRWQSTDGHPVLRVRMVHSVMDAMALLEEAADVDVVFVEWSADLDVAGAGLAGLLRAAYAGVPVVAVGPPQVECSTQVLAQGVQEFLSEAELSPAVLYRAALHSIVRLRRETRLIELSLQDELTGLPRRHVFLDRLRWALRPNNRTALPCCLFFIDLDDFKQVNDQLGHAVGDTVLTTVARRLQRAVRAGDVVARWGGDEFAVLVFGVSTRAMAKLIGEKLLRAVHVPLPDEPAGLPTPTASVGGLFLETAEQAPGELVNRVDMAMYEAKFAGKGRLRLK